MKSQIPMAAPNPSVGFWIRRRRPRRHMRSTAVRDCQVVAMAVPPSTTVATPPAEATFSAVLATFGRPKPRRLTTKSAAVVATPAVTAPTTT